MLDASVIVKLSLGTNMRHCSSGEISITLERQEKTTPLGIN